MERDAAALARRSPSEYQLRIAVQAARLRGVDESVLEQKLATYLTEIEALQPAVPVAPPAAAPAPSTVSANSGDKRPLGGSTSLPALRGAQQPSSSSDDAASPPGRWSQQQHSPALIGGMLARSIVEEPRTEARSRVSFDRSPSKKRQAVPFGGGVFDLPELRERVFSDMARKVGVPREAEGSPQPGKMSLEGAFVPRAHSPCISHRD